MNLRAEVRAIAELVGARQACTKPRVQSPSLGKQYGVAQA